MNLKLVAAFAVLSATPALAQAPQGNIPPPPKPTLGDIHNVVQIISGDKAKAKIYCDIANLDYQIAAAQAAKNQNKFAELVQLVEAMEQKLGPEYARVMAGLQQVDPASKAGRTFGAALQPLEKCVHRPVGALLAISSLAVRLADHGNPARSS